MQGLQDARPQTRSSITRLTSLRRGSPLCVLTVDGVAGVAAALQSLEALQSGSVNAIVTQMIDTPDGVSRHQPPFNRSESIIGTGSASRSLLTSGSFH